MLVFVFFWFYSLCVMKWAWRHRRCFWQIFRGQPTANHTMFISGQMDVQTASACSLHVTQDSRACWAELWPFKADGGVWGGELGALADAYLMAWRASFMASKKRDSSPIVCGRHTGDNPDTNPRLGRDQVKMKTSSQCRGHVLTWAHVWCQFELPFILNLYFVLQYKLIRYNIKSNLELLVNTWANDTAATVSPAWISVIHKEFKACLSQ